MLFNTYTDGQSDYRSRVINNQQSPALRVNVVNSTISTYSNLIRYNLNSFFFCMIHNLHSYVFKKLSIGLQMSLGAAHDNENIY
jgi:hypothetical protein